MIGGLNSSMSLTVFLVPMVYYAADGGEGAHFQEEHFARREPVEGILTCWYKKCVARIGTACNMTYVMNEDTKVRYVC